MLMLALALASATSMSVCEVIRNSDDFDGHTVIVTGGLLASTHATLVFEKSCGGIYVSWSPGTERRMRAFSEAIVGMYSGLGDSGPFRVRLQGVYHAHLPHGDTTIRQLELQEVLAIKSPNGKSAGLAR